MRLRSRAAHRYAKALHDLALGEAVLEQVGADLARIQADLAGAPELRAFVGNYQYPAAKRFQALESLFAVRVHALVWRFIRFLESKRRMGLLDDICTEFTVQEERRKGVVRGRLTSAYPLSVDAFMEIGGGVGRRTRTQLVLKTEENPELLGGCRLQVGDTVYDFSLAARLRMIRQTMMAG